MTQERVYQVAVADIHATMIAEASITVFGTKNELVDFVTSVLFFVPSISLEASARMVARISGMDT